MKTSRKFAISLYIQAQRGKNSVTHATVGPSLEPCNYRELISYTTSNYQRLINASCLKKRIKINKIGRLMTMDKGK